MKADFEKGTKVCSECKRELPIEMFYKNKSKSDGFQSYCKQCCSDYDRGNKRSTFQGELKKVRKAVMKKMYIVAHLERGYEENEV